MLDQKPVIVTGQKVVAKTALAILATLAISLWFGGAALAGGKGGSGGKSHASKSHGSFSKASKTKAGFAKTAKLAKGGQHHHHHRNHRWSKSQYNSQYGCNLYYDANDQCWYYWCSPDNCFYPLDYCPHGTYQFNN